MAVRAPRLQSAKPLTLSRWFVLNLINILKFLILIRWTNGYHGQPIAFVDQSVLFYAIDDGLRFHDYTDNDNQKCLTIQGNGIGVGVIVCSFNFLKHKIIFMIFIGW